MLPRLSQRTWGWFWDRVLHPQIWGAGLGGGLDTHIVFVGGSPFLHVQHLHLQDAPPGHGSVLCNPAPKSKGKCTNNPPGYKEKRGKSKRPGLGAAQLPPHIQLPGLGLGSKHREEGGVKKKCCTPRSERRSAGIAIAKPLPPLLSSSLRAPLSRVCRWRTPSSSPPLPKQPIPPRHGQ